MGKTISLKLTNNEEKTINELRKNGVSPSTLLRELLHSFIFEKNGQNFEKGYKQVNQVNQVLQEKVNQDNQKGYKEVNQVDEIDTLLMAKGYKQVNQVYQNYKEKENLDNQKGYKEVNQVDQDEHFYLRLYTNQLLTRIDQLESELDEWKQRFTMESQQWKDAYTALQLEYQAQTKEALKRVDDKFDRLLFYFDESQKPSLQTMNLGSEQEKTTSNHHEKRKETVVQRKRFPMIRM